MRIWTRPDLWAFGVTSIDTIGNVHLGISACPSGATSKLSGLVWLWWKWSAGTLSLLQFWDLPRVFFLGGLSPRMRITHTVAHWRLRGALITVWGQQECPEEMGPKRHQGEKETCLRRIKIWVNLTHWFWVFFETMYIQIEEPAPPHYVHHQRMYQKMP